MRTLPDEVTRRTDPPIASRQIEDIRANVAEVRKQLGYLSRNMVEAFDGNLTDIEANAYAALSACLGGLLSIDEDLGILALREREANASESGTYATGRAS